MQKTEVVTSACGQCTGHCGLLITLENGEPVSVVGDPESPPNKGGLCKIGRASLEYLHSPDRLPHPLKRVGQRGEGKWEQISWEEAFSLAAEGLNKVKQEHGPEPVFMAHGSAKGFMDTYLVRLANAFGTPNVACSDHVCHVPRVLAAELTLGFFPEPEYDHPPACLMTWGVNKAETRFFQHKAILAAKSKGAKLIAVDPLETHYAKSADVWLQVRPGADLALALGMIHVMIDEGLYDKDFVNQWTVGFDRLKANVQDYTPEKVAEITWVPAELFLKATRLYAANRPGHVEWGNALDHNLNSFQVARAISMLMALSGNLDVPGGEIASTGTGFRFGDTESSGIGIRGRWSYESELRDMVPQEKRKNKVSPDLLPDFRYVTPQAIIKSILEGKPYRLRAGFVQASNPLSSWSNIQMTYEAFRNLDFLAVSDMFMTPTAAMADVVFPVASFLEYDAIASPPASALAQVQRKVAQVGECRSDFEIVNGLAEKLGLEAYFWRDPNGFWDYVLEPTGLTFDEFKKVGRLTRKEGKQYKKYEKDGFKTPSGKVEFYSNRLEEWGFDPVPVYHEPPETPLSDPEMAKEYPLLCTTRKLAEFRHSCGRQIPSLRESHPEPLLHIHPETASKLGIEEGEWAWIETKQGRIRQKAKLSTGVDPRVVVADHAWWFPERNKEELYGWADSNYNVLTNEKATYSPEVGSFNIRGFLCKVYKGQ